MDEQQQQAGSAGEATREAAEQARQQSREIIGQARETGRSLFDRQKVDAVRRASHLARALHDTAHRLRDEGEPEVGNYADWAADGLERISSRIEHSDFDRMSHAFNDFVRRQPALFLGGAILAGIALSRVLASSGERRHGELSGSETRPSESSGVGAESELEPPTMTESGLHARPEAEYGELESRKPGAPSE